MRKRDQCDQDVGPYVHARSGEEEDVLVDAIPRSNLFRPASPDCYAAVSKRQISSTMGSPEMGQHANTIVNPKPTRYATVKPMPTKHHFRTTFSGKMRRKKNKKVSLVEAVHRKYASWLTYTPFSEVSQSRSKSGGSKLVP
jgi:hypothetical protein